MELFSKTNYTDGLQCPKMLWMQKHMPEACDEQAQQDSLIQNGIEVGKLAREYAGEHFLVEQTYDYPQMAADTKAALDTGLTVCEATFTHDGLLCMVDICHPRPDGSLSILEVKATTKVKPYHVDDLAYQVWVIERCGYRVSSAGILHLDSSYRLDGTLDLASLFEEEPLISEIRSRQDAIGGMVAALADLRAAAEEPEAAIGKHCNSPHPCLFQNWCWRNVPEDAVFALSGVGKVRGFKHWENGLRTFADMLTHDGVDKVKLNGFQRAQAARREHFDACKVSSFLKKMHYPLYFLDFETVQPAIPIYQGTKPYQQVPTQFSLHILESSGTLSHREYLAPSSGDPRRGVAEALVDSIPEDVCVVAYNMAFEKGRIKELADFYPDLAARLMAIHGNMCDIMIPFKNGYVYLPAMQGSYSIKKVLPALYPDSEELDYSKLEGVHNGGEAMAAFSDLEHLDPQTEAEVREQLLRYCELDTLAMVRVFEWLVERS